MMTSCKTKGIIRRREHTARILEGEVTKGTTKQTRLHVKLKRSFSTMERKGFVAEGCEEELSQRQRYATVQYREEVERRGIYKARGNATKAQRWFYVDSMNFGARRRTGRIH